MLAPYHYDESESDQPKDDIFTVDLLISRLTFQFQEAGKKEVGGGRGG